MEKEFIELFKGYEGDFGIAHLSRSEFDTERSKLKPDYTWVHKPITPSDYRSHLEGKISIGIQPCRIDKTVQFGCIDIDPKDYSSFKVEKYLALIQQHKLPIVPILSKSGGLHCYVFLKEPIPTIDLMEALKAFLLPLGLKPATEVFPKQKELQKDDKGDIKPGQFINLPYYNHGVTTRYAVDKNNSKLSLEEFIKFANESKVDNEALTKHVEEAHKNILVGTDPEFEDGPPCLARCSLSKLDDGRDRFMYNYMVFAKKKYKDKWPDQVSQANYKYLSVPWDRAKLDSKIKAWRGDTAGHTCYEDPIRDKCMRSLCYKRPFGVKSDKNTDFPEITDFQVIKYADPEYRFNVVMPNDDKKGVVIPNLKSMTTQTELLRLIWSQTFIKFDTVKPLVFNAKLNEWSKNIQKITPPKGTQIEDRLEEELYQKCINGPQAQERSHIYNGSCFTEGGFHYFRWDSFIEHLGSGWNIPGEKMATILRDKCHVKFNHSFNVESKTLKVCKVAQLHTDLIEHKPVERKKTNY